MSALDGSGAAPSPGIDAADIPAPSSYLAKDYASFRALLLDRLSLTMPQWTEQHVPDGYLALLEILAYVGDHLSYEQDAAATEAYLGTARRRISVRRHARLVDYRMSEGCNARVWVCLTVADDVQLDPAALCFITGPRTMPVPPGVLTESALRQVAQDYQVFEPVTRDPIHLYRSRNIMTALINRSDDSAELIVDSGDPQLQRGDVLILTTIDAAGGSANDTNLTGHPVRIHTAPATTDNRITITWAPADRPPPTIRSAGTVAAYGNVVLADHGASIDRLARLYTGDSTTRKVRTSDAGPIVTARLPVRNVTWRTPPHAEVHADSAAEMLVQDPRNALAELHVIDLALRSPTAPAGSRSSGWQQRPDLLASGPAGQHFVVEVDDDSVAWLRFGDGRLGAEAAADADLTFLCRVGNGAVGNVSANTINNLVTDDPRALAVTAIRNPLPAQGGQDPEPVDDVRLAAPAQLRTIDMRALTAADYERIASTDLQVLAAAARLRWSGARTVADVHILPREASSASQFNAPTLAPRGTVVVDDDLIGRVRSILATRRRIGHDVHLLPAYYVAIEVGLQVTPARGSDAQAVKRTIEKSLAGMAASDQKADPASSPFGGFVAESILLERVLKVPGVDHARVTKLTRRDTESGDNTPAWQASTPAPLINLAWNEIAVLHPVEISGLP